VIVKQSVIDKAIKQWWRRLQACIRAAMTVQNSNGSAC